MANGFTMNPYNLCVATNKIDGKQMMIYWHVDNMKVLHKRRTGVTKTEHWLRSTYGNISVSGGRHTYLWGWTWIIPKEENARSLCQHT